MNKEQEQIKNIDYEKFLKTLENESVDFICIDPPYGKNNGMILSGQKEKINWDVTIDWEKMFYLFNKILKPGGTIAVFGQQPTYSEMIKANIKNFKYEYVWIKNNSAQGFHSNKMPLIYTENIAIFLKPGGNRKFIKPYKIQEIPKNEYFNRWYSQQLFYYIGKTRREIHKDLNHRKLEFYFHFVGSNFNLLSEKLYNDLIKNYKINNWNEFIPYNELKRKWLKEKERNKGIKLDSAKYNGTFNNILKISKDHKPYLHPTQKPLELIETLIKIYTNEGDKVLDCFFGSGTTWLASKKLKREFLGSEIDLKYFEIAKKRVKKWEFML